ncbi:MAG: hypothetical protein NW220_13340 [Leptolyngbyaceae cyanobacterium bins.349]|nr:hypothetical protein [Leptolyngbyaceae cyanobacterium bins.349]
MVTFSQGAIAIATISTLAKKGGKLEVRGAGHSPPPSSTRSPTPDDHLYFSIHLSGMRSP